jgi:CSLREA domain-containing protein
MKSATSSRLLLASRVLLAGLLFNVALTPAVLAASFTVNTDSDTHDSNPGNGRCADASGKCSLRAAIEEINRLPAFPPGIITLPAGTYNLMMGQLQIMHSLDLNGAGSNITFIDGNLSSRVFVISNTGTNPIVNISDVTIQHGLGTGPNSNSDPGCFLQSGNPPPPLTDCLGAGVFVGEETSLFLSDSVVSGNQSDVGGVGIANSGSLKLFRSTVQNNVITGGGGGLTGVGAGILNHVQSPGQTTTPVAEIIESTISNNQGIRGGGIDNEDGEIDITNSTISGNIASVGGGIRNVPPGVVNISFSTITNNQAGFVSGEPSGDRVGGGIANLGGQVNIGNTILARNTYLLLDSATPFAPDCFSKDDFKFTSFRGNLVGILNANCNMQDTIFGGTPFDQTGTPGNPLDPGLDQWPLTAASPRLTPFLGTVRPLIGVQA